MSNDLKGRAETLRRMIEESRAKTAELLQVVQKQEDQICQFEDEIERLKERDVVDLERQELLLEKEAMERKCAKTEKGFAKNRKAITKMKERLKKLEEAVDRTDINLKRKEEELKRLKADNMERQNEGKLFTQRDFDLLRPHVNKVLSKDQLLQLTSEINQGRPVFNYKSSIEISQKLKSLALEPKEEAKLDEKKSE